MKQVIIIESKSKYLVIVIPIAGLLVALFFGGFFILITGNNPLYVYGIIINRVFGSLFGFTSLLRWMIPLLIISVSASFSLKAGLWNLGMEGQMYLGALFSAWVGFSLVGQNGFLIIILAFLISVVAGCLWALIPALLKAFFSVNEFITSLLLNFVAVLLTDFFTINLWQDRSMGGQTLSTYNIAESARFGKIIPGYSWHNGFYLSLIILFLFWYVMRYTSLGYSIRILGNNPRFLKYGGGSPRRTILVSMGISGAIAGIAGFVEIFGITGAFYTRMFHSGIAWDGLVVALLGMMQPFGLLFASFLFGFLKTGILSIERFTNISRSVVTIIQAFIILFIAVQGNLFSKKKKILKTRKESL